MPGITVAEAIDLGHLTLNSFKRDEFEYVLTHHGYPICNRLFSGRDVDIQTGKLITRSIVLGSTGNADHVKLFESDEQNITNITEEIQVPWKHAKSSFSWELREIMVQNGPEGYISLMKVRNTNMYAELADEIELRGWLSPDSSTDKDNPFGIPYWLVTGAAAEEGFHGDNPRYADGNEITAGAGNIDTDDFSGWKNYYSDYDEVNDDFLKRLSRAFRKTKFKSPTMVDSKTGTINSPFTLHSNDSVIGDLEDLALKSDDRVGADLGKYAGAVVFKRIPIEYVDNLDTDATGYDENCHGINPIYGVNWNYFEPVILKGDNFRRNKPINDREQHNVMTVFVDLTWNIVCTNRRKAGFVISIET